MRKASRILSVRRLQIWDKQGKIKCVRTVGDKRRIPESELKRFLGIKGVDVSAKAVIYVRVSSYDQKQNLERQSLLGMLNRKDMKLSQYLRM